MNRFFRASVAALLLCGALTLAARAQPYAKETPAASAPASQPAPEQASGEDEYDAYRHSAAVQSFGRVVGLNPQQAASAFTLVNLAILVGLLGWFLAKRLPKTFRDRSTAIQKHLVEARTATEDAAIRLAGVEQRLSKLDEQIAAMRTQAELESARDEQRIKASVEDEKAKILAAADQEIAAATVHARRQIQQYAAELAIEQAARKLSISAETDRLLVQSFSSRLGQDESKEGQN